MDLNEWKKKILQESQQAYDHYMRTLGALGLLESMIKEDEDDKGNSDT